MSIDAMKQALEALRFGLHVGFDESSESQIKKGGKAFDQHSKAITALRQAIEQAEKQEPVACQYAVDVAMPEYRCVGKCQYTTPPAAQRQPLQGDKEGWYWVSPSHCISIDMIRTVEKLHGIGGGE